MLPLLKKTEERGGNLPLVQVKLIEILENLKAPIPDNKISTKKIQGQVIRFVSWHDYCDLLDIRAGLGSWMWEITDSRELSPISKISGTTDNGETYTRFCNARLVIVGKLTIIGDDRSVSFSASGEELLNCSNYGDPSSNAEAMSLRRACAIDAVSP